MPKGFRPQKEPTRKEMRQRMIEAEALAAMREQELILLNKNWGLKFDMIVNMFEAATEDKIDEEKIISEKVTEFKAHIDSIQTVTNMQQAAAHLQQAKTLMEEINQAYLMQSLSILHWFQTWTDDVDSIDHSADDAGDQMNRIIEKHGFDFSITPIAVTHEDMCGRVVN